MSAHLFASSSQLPLEPAACPFFESRQHLCQAAFSGRSLDRRRGEKLCATDEHDRCPLFLSKLLRSSRPHFGADTQPMRDK